MTTIHPLGSTLRVLRPAPFLFAFYDGRVPGGRVISEAPNWTDDGAYELGVTNYAIVEGEDALVYDTHISLAHARIVRQTLVDAGVRRTRVVLSHWHKDHVAGNAVFQDCEIIAHAGTRSALEARRAAIESAFPPINPLILPNRIYQDRLSLEIGGRTVELRHVDIHTRDATMLLLPEARLLLVGDALEDPVTYVAEADRLACHLADLERMAGWSFDRILPTHGVADIIAGGGYGTGLITATRLYIERLIRCRSDPALRQMDLRDLMADAIAAGWITYFEPYQTVHLRNLEAVLACDPALPPA